MPISHEFEYERPATLAEALELLAAHGGDACVLAGGTDVVARLRDDLATPGLVIDIKTIGELQGISVDAHALRIGALATFTEIAESALVREHAPILAEAAATVASIGIRNRATLAGNICSAVPSCDGGPPLLVLEASVNAAGQKGRRTISVGDWFTGPKRTSLHPDELATSIDVPLATGRHGAAYVKLGRYKGEDLAQAGVAVLMTDSGDRRVAFGAVGPTPARAPRIEDALAGGELDDSLVAKVKELVARETSPITDIRATKEYREHMLPVMLERALRAAASRLRGEGPAYGASLV